MGFAFLHFDPLIDDELELVPPASQWIDEMIEAAHHPLTVRDMPGHSYITRAGIEQFLKTSPGGRIMPDPERGISPGYHFWMRLTRPRRGEPAIAGTIGLRISCSPDIEMYFGHIGYKVFPIARGRRYAERGARLLLPLARAHGMTTLWITCNPDNIASRKTCERLGSELVEIVPVPPDHPLYARGDREKCRYRWRL